MWDAHHELAAELFDGNRFRHRFPLCEHVDYNLPNKFANSLQSRLGVWASQLRLGNSAQRPTYSESSIVVTHSADLGKTKISGIILHPEKNIIT